eukprot:symbB.v1.2.040307.t1/scaffold7139.1/size13073/1
MVAEGRLQVLERAANSYCFHGAHHPAAIDHRSIVQVSAKDEATMPLSFDTLACPSGGLKDVNGLTGGEKNRSE